MTYREDQPDSNMNYPEDDMPDSLMSPADEPMLSACIEPFARRKRSELWLTIREGRKFILKGLPEELRYHPEEEARLRKEYSLGLRINHPGVAGVYGYEHHPLTGSVILMEYVDGIPLNQFLHPLNVNPTENSNPIETSSPNFPTNSTTLNNTTKLNTNSNPVTRRATTSQHSLPPQEQRLAIACKVADALTYIHSLGISHRVLKPANILIARNRHEAKIIDLGLGDSDDSVLYKKSLGTTEFGAPEQQQAVVGDTASDVFSFGRILELLLPETRFRTLRTRCLQPDPKRRPSMAEVSQTLSTYTNSKNGKGRYYLIGGLVFIVLLSGGLYLFFNRATSTTKEEMQETLVPTSPELSDTLNTIPSSEVNSINPTSPIEEPASPAATDAPEIDTPKSSSSQDIFTDLYRRHITEADNVIKKYGNIPYPTAPGLTEAEIKKYAALHEKKNKETFDIADRLTRELKRDGASAALTDQLVSKYWQHIAEPNKPAAIDTTPTPDIYTSIYNQYVEEADRAIASYGSLAPQILTDSENKESKENREYGEKLDRRTKQTFDIADRLEKELKGKGAATELSDRLLSAYWLHVTNSTNKIDGLEEFLKSSD